MGQTQMRAVNHRIAKPGNAGGSDSGKCFDDLSRPLYFFRMRHESFIDRGNMGRMGCRLGGKAIAPGKGRLVTDLEVVRQVCTDRIDGIYTGLRCG